MIEKKTLCSYFSFWGVFVELCRMKNSREAKIDQFKEMYKNVFLRGRGKTCRDKTCDDLIKYNALLHVD